MSDYVKKINSKEIAASEVVPGSSLETKINSVTGGAVVKATIRTGGADQTTSFAKIVIDTTKTEFGYIKFRLTVIGTNYTANAGTESASVDMVIKISPKDNTFFSIVERTVRSDGEAGLIGSGIYWQNGSTIYLGMRTSSYYGRVAVEVIECYGVDNIFTYEIGNFDSNVSSMTIQELNNRTSAFSVANNGAGSTTLPVYAKKNGNLEAVGSSIVLPTDGQEAQVSIGTDANNKILLDATPATGTSRRGLWTINNGTSGWLIRSEGDGGEAHVGNDGSVTITNGTGWRSTTKCYVGGIPVNGVTFRNTSTAHTIFYFGKVFGTETGTTTTDCKVFTGILTVSTLANLNESASNRASGFTAIVQINYRQASERHVTINVIADDDWDFNYIPTLVCNAEDEDSETLYRYGICFMDDDENLKSFTYTKFDMASLCECDHWRNDRWFSSTSKLNTMTFFGGDRRFIIRDRRPGVTNRNAYMSVRNSKNVYTNLEAWDNSGDVKCGLYASNGGTAGWICYKDDTGKNYFNGTATRPATPVVVDYGNRTWTALQYIGYSYIGFSDSWANSDSFDATTLKVGDTARLYVTISNMANAHFIVEIKVTAVPSTSSGEITGTVKAAYQANPNELLENSDGSADANDFIIPGTYNLKKVIQITKNWPGQSSGSSDYTSLVVQRSVNTSATGSANYGTQYVSQEIYWQGRALWRVYPSSGSWSDWHSIAYLPTAYTGAGATNLPVYISSDGVATAVNAATTMGNLIRNMGAWTSPSDNNESIPAANTTSGGTTQGRYTFAEIWNWIKSKLGTAGSTYVPIWMNAGVPTAVGSQIRIPTAGTASNAEGYIRAACYNDSNLAYLDSTPSRTGIWCKTSATTSDSGGWLIWRDTSHNNWFDGTSYYLYDHNNGGSVKLEVGRLGTDSNTLYII